MGRTGRSRRTENNTAQSYNGLNSPGGKAEGERGREGEIKNSRDGWVQRREIHSAAGVEKGSRRLTPRQGDRDTETRAHTHTNTDATHQAGQEVTPVTSIVPTPQAKLPRRLIHC